jgi:NADH-quinone oxidoreductase subunit G
LGALEVAYIGPSMDLTFNTAHLGLSTKRFFDLIKGKHSYSKKLKLSRNPIFLISGSSLSSKELVNVSSILQKNLGLSSSCLNVLNTDASNVGLREVGIKGIETLTNKKLNLYVGTNLNNTQIKSLFKNSDFSIYCGSHGTNETNKSNLVLPGKTFTEKKGSFFNLEGFLQNTNRSLVGLGESREDWKIFNAFFEYLGVRSGYRFVLNKVSYNNFFSLRYFFASEYTFFKKSISLYTSPLHFNFCYSGSLKKNSLLHKNRVKNFYKTTIISSLSRVMAECSKNRERSNFNK